MRFPAPGDLEKHTGDIQGVVVSLLAEKYPKTFFVFEKRRRPLKIGIHRDIIADLGDAIDEKLLSMALFVYTVNLTYLLHLKDGAARVDLSGNEAGKVTANDAHGAKSARQRIINNRLQRKQAEQGSIEPSEPKPAKPIAKKQAKGLVVETIGSKAAVAARPPAKGDGLSSLKAAWQARKSGGCR